MKIIDYRLISEPLPGLMEMEVRELIEKGFQPYGIPYFADREQKQAMVKYEKTTEELVQEINLKKLKEMTDDELYNFQTKQNGD